MSRRTSKRSGSVVAALVAVRRADEQQHRAARGHRRAVVLDVAQRRSGRGAGRSAGSAASPRPRSGSATRSSTSARRWSGWSPSTRPSQPMSRPVVSLPAPAITCVYESTSSRVSVRSAPVVVLELRVEQRGHQVVGRVLGAPVDVLGEHRAVGDRVLLHRHRLAVLGAQHRVGLAAAPRSGRSRGCRAACR